VSRLWTRDSGNFIWRRPRPDRPAAPSRRRETPQRMEVVGLPLRCSFRHAMPVLSTASCSSADGEPRVSVIIRTKNSASTVGHVLSQVRAQSVPAEIIIVDSGSSDDTLAIVGETVDRVIELPAEHFSFGHALNVGAAAARAPVHMALSSHSFPPDRFWIERSLSKYQRSDVAGTSGAPTPPHSPEPLLDTFFQTHSDALQCPWWGFSNTGSSWRADVWARFPFDEQLAACEDKEWGFRVLAAGWSIAIDAHLLVSDAHRRRDGLKALYTRAYREYEAISAFASIPPYTASTFLREWLSEIPSHAPYFGWRRRLNYFRVVELAAKYRAFRASSASAPPPIGAPPRDSQPNAAPRAADSI
jgi:rhamnosyltransferase